MVQVVGKFYFGTNRHLLKARSCTKRFYYVVKLHSKLALRGANCFISSTVGSLGHCPRDIWYCERFFYFFISL